MITGDPYGISHAERPWVEPGKRRRERINTYDTLEQIRRCQRCTRVDCVDCISARSAARKTIRDVERDQEFLRLYKAGKTDKEISQVMGIKAHAVFYRRKCYDFPPNPPRKKECSNED